MRSPSPFFKNSITSARLRLQILCNCSWTGSCPPWLKFVDQFSPFLFGVQHIVLQYEQYWSSGQDNVDGEQWLQLVRFVWLAQDPYRLLDELTTGILCALRLANEGYTSDTLTQTVLPSLRNIRVRKPMPLHWLFWDAAHLLITSRGLSSHPVEAVELQFVCNDCNTGFTSQILKEHLVSLASHTKSFARIATSSLYYNTFTDSKNTSE
jgi:hypothetical protein